MFLLSNTKLKCLFNCITFCCDPQLKHFPCNLILFPQFTTGGENLGIAAFVFSLLALTINVAILFWLACQKFGVTLPISNTAKGKGH